MKFAIVFAGLLAVALARPNTDTTVLRSESDVSETGYNLVLETSDGTNRQEQGELKTYGPEEAAINVRGSYSWVAPDDGKTYTINFVADETGYHPEGEHIPKLGGQ